MNRIYNCAICVVAASLATIGLASCSKDNGENKNQDKEDESMAILSEAEFTFEEIADMTFGDDAMGMNAGAEMDEYTRAMNEMREGFERDALAAIEEEGGENGIGTTTSFTVEVVTFEYPTVDANGNTYMLSGELSIPKLFGYYGKVKGLILSHHPTSFNDDMLGQASFKSLTADGMAVLEPHYQGFLTTSSMPQTYLCQKLIGRQCADMIPAALQVLKDKGVPIADDMATYIVGYSQGGGNAMATARYLQEEAPASLRAMANVKKLNVGAGPYNPYATFQQWLKSDSVSFSVVLPMVIKGMMTGHADVMKGISMESYFSELYLSTGVVQAIDNQSSALDMQIMMVDQSSELESICLGAAGVMQYWMRFSAIMSAECANPNSKIRTALERCLKMETVNDWVPSYPVELFSSKGDNIISYQANTLDTYNMFRNAGCNVTLTHPIGKPDHLLSQVYWMGLINLDKSYK